MLLDIRFFVGRFFGWDREPDATVWDSFATRLTAADRAKSLTLAGTREGLFRVVYPGFENELLLELINRTVHAAALSALVETANSYRFYFAVYVRRVGRLTSGYMALIDPFREVDRSIRRSCAPSARPGIKPSAQLDNALLRDADPPSVRSGGVTLACLRSAEIRYQ